MISAEYTGNVGRNSKRSRRQLSGCTPKSVHRVSCQFASYSKSRQEDPRVAKSAQERLRAPRSGQRGPGAAQEWPWRSRGPKIGLKRPRRTGGGLPEAPRGPSRGAQEAFKNLPERAGTKTREDRTRQEETTEDEDKTSQVKRRPTRQKPAQDKTRQDKGTHDKRRPEGRSVCSETSLLHYTVPQKYKRSVGSTKAAAT